MNKVPDIKELSLYNVLYDDHAQVFVCASSFGKAAAAAYSVKDGKIMAITFVKYVNVLI